MFHVKIWDIRPREEERFFEEFDFEYIEMKKWYDGQSGHYFGLRFFEDNLLINEYNSCKTQWWFEYSVVEAD